jgi:hypothetical protein
MKEVRSELKVLALMMSLSVQKAMQGKNDLLHKANKTHFSCFSSSLSSLECSFQILFER